MSYIARADDGSLVLIYRGRVTSELIATESGLYLDEDGGRWETTGMVSVLTSREGDSVTALEVRRA